ncbi:MAG: hypothetical protein ABIN97_20800 [Ginsengibacter sp.]
MTVVIKKNDSKEVIQKKFNKLRKRSSSQKTFIELCGVLKGAFKEDPVELQRKWRSEWD